MTLALAAVALVVAAVGATLAIVRVRIRRLTAATHDLVRDPSRRLPFRTLGGELRPLASWIDALAEDAQRARDALVRDRALLTALADRLSDGVIAIDDERKIEMLNEAARKMLGVHSALIGAPLLEFVRVPELAALVERPEDASAEVQLPGGARAMIHAARTWGRAGRVLLLEDVTNVRKLETVRQDFVANVSHELRTPLAVIRANAETLLAGANSDPVMAPRLIEGLHRNAERLARLLADLLDLSRLDAGQYRMDLAPVALRAVAEQSLAVVESNAQQRKVTIDVAIPAQLAVQADAKALDQVLVNLVDNAIKYTRSPEGHVWLEAREAGNAVRVEVRDDGPGIAEKHRDRVFERFYRADPGRSRDLGGTGLGLSIVKHLVERMGGEVGVEPNEPRGSTFWVRLPRAVTKVAA